MLDFSGGTPQKEDKRLAVSWNELGNAHMMNKEWTSAEGCFIRSMNALKQLDKFKKVDLSFPIINLGFSYWLQGRLEEADKTLAEILEVREAAYGINDQESFM
jgi:tetratricopeptide (TPR) repeat protein